MVFDSLELKNNGVIKVRRRNWYIELEKEDDLNIGKMEMQELEDDELSLSEAAFYKGYLESYEEGELEDYY